MDASRTERMSVKEMVNGGYSEFYDAMGFKDNPSLDFSAKAYIALLTRDLDVKKNGPTDVGMRDAGLEEKIRKLVYRGGEKREFAEVVEELNKSNGPKSNVVVVPVFDPEDKINAHPLGITISGMTAKFVERVIEGSGGNCLEYALTLALIGKTFYETDGIESQPAMWEDKRGRHFCSVWVESKSNERQEVKITTYGGGTLALDEGRLKLSNKTVSESIQQVVDWKRQNESDKWGSGGGGKENLDEESTRLWRRCEVASSDLAGIVDKKSALLRVDVQYRRTAGVYLSSEARARLDFDGSETLAVIMEKARQAGIAGVMFGGGIAYRGDISGEEVPTDRLPGRRIISSVREKASRMVAEGIAKSLKEAGKLEDDRTALDFLSRAGYGLVITIDPQKSESAISSLRADMAAEMAITQTFKAYKMKLDEVTFSNHGNKKLRLFTEAFLTVQNAIEEAKWKGWIKAGQKEVGIEHILLRLKTEQDNRGGKVPMDKAHIRQPLRDAVFPDAGTALDYFKSKAGGKIMIGGIPLNWSELAFLGSIALRDENPITRKAREAFFAVANQAVRVVGENEDQPIISWLASEKAFPRETAILISRLLEMGRAKGRIQDESTGSDIFEMTQKIVSERMGSLVVLSLMDRSRKVVDASQGGATLLLEEILGKEHVLTVQTRPGVEVTRPDVEDEGPISLPDDHNEIKNVHFDLLRSFISMKLLGLLSNDRGLTTDVKVSLLPNKVLTEFASRYLPVEVIPGTAKADEGGARVWPELKFDYMRYHCAEEVLRWAKWVEGVNGKKVSEMTAREVMDTVAREFSNRSGKAKQVPSDELFGLMGNMTVGDIEVLVVEIRKGFATMEVKIAGDAEILTRDSNWAIEKQGGELLTRFPDHSESLKLKERSLVDS